jgi:hypothetical protein
MPPNTQLLYKKKVCSISIFILQHLTLMEATNSTKCITDNKREETRGKYDGSKGGSKKRQKGEP